MTDADIKKLAVEYIDEALAGSSDASLAEGRKAAVEQVEEASRELLTAVQEGTVSTAPC